MEATTTIAQQALRLANVLAEVDPSARVPTCPEWSAADLLWHLTTVHAFWAAVLRLDVRSADQVAEVERAAPQRPQTLAQMLPLRERYTAELVDELERLPDQAPRWSWFDPDQTVGFTRRMQTAEALMHRVDAELTARLPIGPIPAEVAVAAVDHAVDVMRAWMPDGASYQRSGTVALESSDTADRWLVELGSWSGTNPWTGAAMTGYRLRRLDPTAGERPLATVRAALPEVALWAWTRPGVVATEGQPAVVKALLDLFASPLQ